MRESVKKTLKPITACHLAIWDSPGECHYHPKKIALTVAKYNPAYHEFITELKQMGFLIEGVERTKTVRITVCYDLQEVVDYMTERLNIIFQDNPDSERPDEDQSDR